VKIELQQHIVQKNQDIERIRAEKQNLQIKLENEQQVHVEVIAECDQMIEDKEELIRQLQGVIRAKEGRYHTELVLQQERHVQEIVEQTETIAARE
jgi:formyltetrahydrofolate synthetase